MNNLNPSEAKQNKCVCAARGAVTRNPCPRTTDGMVNTHGIPRSQRRDLMCPTSMLDISPTVSLIISRLVTWESTPKRVPVMRRAKASLR